MNRIKPKASLFLGNAPSQDERAANAFAGQVAAFGAGIERRLRKKPSRFFRKQNDQPPVTPPVTGSPPEAPPSVSKDDTGGYERLVVNNTQGLTAVATDKPLPSRPNSAKDTGIQVQAVASEESSGAMRKANLAELMIKKRPSFVSLRMSSSRIFRTTTGYHDPPPPVPQIPISTPTPKPRRAILPPLKSVRSARASRPSSSLKVSISWPVSFIQPWQLPTEDNASKVPLTKASGPPPPRPPRPESFDDELIALRGDGRSRIVLQTRNSARTLTSLSSSSAHSKALACVESEEPYTCFNSPSGHSSLSSPRSPTFDSPLAANFPLDPSRPLPFRDSSGSVIGYGRFSAFIKASQQYRSGGYEDGVDPDDRDLGPIEMYCESKCADWTLEKRVSGKLGERGMLFRDRRGGWHLVADI